MVFAIYYMLLGGALGAFAFVIICMLSIMKEGEWHEKRLQERERTDDIDKKDSDKGN